MNAKLCPKCRSRSDLDAAFCSRCGRQFRTAFTPEGMPDRTQMLSAPYAPPPAPPVPPPVGAPADGTERAVSLAWTLVGTGTLALLFFSSLRTLRDAILRDLGDGLAFGLVFFVLISLGFSWLLMRLRRLYVYAPGVHPAEIPQRRQRFALATTIGVSFLFLLGILWPSTEDLQRARMRREPVPIEYRSH